MKPRQDSCGDLLEIRAFYSVGAMARIANVSANMMRRILRANGVTFVRTGRVLLVPLSEIRNKVPPLWDSLSNAELLRRGACPNCGWQPPAPGRKRRSRDASRPSRTPVP